jgi:hypothetical protein
MFHYVNDDAVRIGDNETPDAPRLISQSVNNSITAS